MADHINFFVPFEKRPPWHEDQLTRALLVTLRYSPAALQAWLGMVAPHRRLHELTKPEFATQRRQVLAAGSDGGDEAIPGISVWLAPDAPDQLDGIVADSDRGQVLDGVIRFGDDLVIIVESKIGWSGLTDQPHQINLHGAPVRFDGPPISVRWQDVLAMLYDLVERELVAGAERLMIEDMLQLVETHFARIGPYVTLGRCDGNEFRIERRLDALLGEAVMGDDGRGAGWRDVRGSGKISMVQLAYSPGRGSVYLRGYPGDTLTQARSLYKDDDAVARLLALRGDGGWDLWPNMHFGHISKGLAWVKAPASTEEYVAHWVGAVAGGVGAVSREDWPAFWSSLLDARIVPANGRATFDAAFTHTGRATATPRPGMCIEFVWPLAEATRLDADGSFTGVLRDRVAQLLDALTPGASWQQESPVTALA